MPRKASLPDEIHNYNFERLSKTENGPKARMRMLGMFHLRYFVGTVNNIV